MTTCDSNRKCVCACVCVCVCVSVALVSKQSVVDCGCANSVSHSVVSEKPIATSPSPSVGIELSLSQSLKYTQHAYALAHINTRTWVRETSATLRITKWSNNIYKTQKYTGQQLWKYVAHAAWVFPQHPFQHLYTTGIRCLVISAA